MLLIGILAIIQTIFLPGFVLINLLNIRTNTFIQKWIYIFALSLFSNYLMVTVLTLFSIYKAVLIFIIIVIECVIIFSLVYSKRATINLNLNFRSLISEYIYFIKSLSKGDRILLGTVSTIVLFYFALFVSNIGTIFYFVDTVYHTHHWNTWAIDFANNIFPRQSSHFPQLIPTNWSISYLLIGEPNVHFFPKSIMPLFFFGNLMMFLDLALSKRNKVFLFGLIIYAVLGPVVYNIVFMADGNGDLPVSFFAFLTFYAFIKTDEQNFILKEYILIFLFAATAAGTKLAGFYVFFFMSILCLYKLFLNYKKLNKKDWLILVVAVLVILFTNLFWHFLKPDLMVEGLHQPEYLASDFSSVLINALHLLFFNIGLPLITFLIITIFFSFFVKESKYVSIFLVIPPLVLWMFKYSADFRNLSFVIPFISYVSSFGLVRIIEILKNKRIKDFISPAFNQNINYKVKVWWVYIIGSVGVLFFMIIRTDFFYSILYSFYKFISKYYFHSNRISYLTDITFFIYVDYYQNIISYISLLLFLISLLYLFKLKSRDILILVFLSTIFLNFTYITKPVILNHQKKEFQEVDARNYYQRINTIINSTKMSNEVYTNFRAICTEKIPREVSFFYIDEGMIREIINNPSTSKAKLYFFNLDLLNNEIKEKILKNEMNIIFDDGTYLFFSF